MNGIRSDQDTHSSRALRVLSLSTVLGVAALVVYSLQATSRSVIFSIVGVGLLVSGASLVFGGVLGFLFGIPRTLHRDGPSADSSDDEASVHYRVNTNLEEISDWLTKMLVGVGLIQLTSMPIYIGKITAYLAVGFGNRPSDSVLALSLILYFSIIGFLYSYLWTRLYLASAFRQADLGAIGLLASRVEQTDKKIDEFKKQTELDVEALNLTYRQLNPGPEVPKVPQEQLDASIAAASQPIKVQIFNQAWRVRADNWANNKPLMEQSIPIFQALIKSDPDNRYHMNHGQLGFALKDRQQPDWAAAESELSTAIQIRGPWQEQGWLFYEFNRAICRIMLDEAFSQNEPSDPPHRDAILMDLRDAWRGELKGLLKKDISVTRWLETNKIRESDLRQAARN